MAKSEIRPASPLLKWLVEMAQLMNGEQITIPAQYRDQVLAVKDLLENDVTGLVNTLLDFSINAAVDVDYIVETNNINLSEILNNWLYSINSSITGVPTGIEGLAKEYYRERWKGSSFLLLRTVWEAVDGISLPTKMWFVDGEDIVEEQDAETVTLGDETYKLRVTNTIYKTLPTGSAEKIYVQKPYESWGTVNTTPFLIQRGLYKNAKLLEMLFEKSNMVIAKALEYLLLIKKGTEGLAKEGRDEFIYSNEDLRKAKEAFGLALSERSTTDGITTYMTNFDTELEHLIPEYERALKSTLYAPIEKRILAGLGMVDIVEGAASIDKDEYVLVKIDNNLKQIKVSNIENQLLDDSILEVPTYENGLLVWKKADLWSHEYNGTMYNLISDEGRMRVRTTGNHSIMVWKDGSLLSKRADEIKKGDYILTAKNFNITNLKYLDISYNNYLGSNQFSKVVEPVSIKVDENFAYFLGWLVAEGSPGKWGISLCIGTNKTEAEKVLAIGELVLQTKGQVNEKLYETSKNKPLYFVNFRKRGIGELFTKLCNKGAKTKKVPEIIFNSPISVQKAFLRGLFEGDGHCYRGEPKSTELSANLQDWELTTASEELAYGVITLLRILGESPSLRKHTRKYQFSNQPVNTGTYYIVFVKKNEGACPKELFPRINTHGGSITNLNTIDKFIQSLPKDWIIKKIEQIETYKYNDLVYDMEVADNPTFVAGTNILVHNSTRRESILNPKPFIGEVKAGITDFKVLMRDVMADIIRANKPSHKKFFSDGKIIEIRNTPVKIFMTEDYKGILKGMYDRGILSKRTYCEVCGEMDFDQEIERRKSEIPLELLLWPPVVQNQEATPDPIKETTKDPEKEDKSGPEATDYNNANLETSAEDKIYEEAPYKTNNDLPDNVKSVLPARALTIWRTVFNNVLNENPNNEDYARKTAWSIIKKLYTKKDDKWVKKSKGELEESLAQSEEIELMQMKKLEVLGKQAKLLDKLIGSNTSSPEGDKNGFNRTTKR